jgi:putative transposase
MDGKSAWRDNLFLERFWRTIKYEEVYLHAYEDVGEARRSIARTQGDLHVFGGRTPDQAYFDPLPLRTAPSSRSCTPLVPSSIS